MSEYPLRVAYFANFESIGRHGIIRGGAVMRTAFLVQNQKRFNLKNGPIT